MDILIILAIIGVGIIYTVSTLFFYKKTLKYQTSSLSEKIDDIIISAMMGFCVLLGLYLIGMTIYAYIFYFWISLILTIILLIPIVIILVKEWRNK